MKKLWIFLSALVMTMVLLVIGVFAAEPISYEDYSQNGINGEAPIFTFLGYGINEGKTDICVDYTVDLNALEAFENSSGIKLEYGVVAAVSRFLNGQAPLDSKTAQPIDISSQGGIVGKKVQSNTKISHVSLILTNISEDMKDEEFYICLYVYDGTEVQYITDVTATLTPTPVSYTELTLPTEYKINNNVIFSLTKPESTIAYDRNKQMGISKNEYGTPVIDANTYTSSRIDEIWRGANIIAGNALSWKDTITALGAKVAFPNASSFMKNYISNTGADYTINMGTGTNGFFKSGAGTLTHRVTRVNQALRAAEALAREGKSISIYQQTEDVNHFSDTEDWYLAVGSYFTCIEMHNVTVTENADGTKTYSAQLVYNVADYYNWNENSWSTIPIVDVSQRDLHQLHRLQKAKEFESKGSVTYNLTWTEGQDASSLTFK